MVSRGELRDYTRVARAQEHGRRTAYWLGWLGWAKVALAVGAVVALVWSVRWAEEHASVGAPSWPDWSMPALPDVPWPAVAWSVGALVMAGLAVWAWRRRSGYGYRLPWRYRLRRMFRRY